MVEFAFVFPVFIMGILAVVEIAVIIFVSSSIESAILQASRFGSISGENTTLSRQERVLAIIRENTYGLVSTDEMDLDTFIYRSFEDVGKPEPFTDANDNGKYDDGETFQDINGNGKWDEDMGRAGLGGPDDIVVYRVQYSWGLMTPLIQIIAGEKFRYSSSVALRNEPE